MERGHWMVSFGIALKSCYYIHDCDAVTHAMRLFSFLLYKRKTDMYSCLSGALYMNLVVTAYKGRNMSNYIGYTTQYVWTFLYTWFGFKWADDVIQHQKPKKSAFPNSILFFFFLLAIFCCWTAALYAVVIFIVCYCSRRRKGGTSPTRWLCVRLYNGVRAIKEKP
jgi:hypothetical protein